MILPPFFSLMYFLLVMSRERPTNLQFKLLKELRPSFGSKEEAIFAALEQVSSVLQVESSDAVG